MIEELPPQERRSIGNDEVHTSREVQEFFESQSESYKNFFEARTRTGSSHLFKLRAQLATEVLANRGRGTFLDLATGTGEITAAIAKSADFDTLHLNDLSKGMLDSCRKVFECLPLRGSVSWTNSDAFNLLRTASPNSYDVVLCLGLIAHTGQLDLLLSQVFAALKPGGVLILQSSLTDHFGVRLVGWYARSPLRRTKYRVSCFSKKQILKGALRAGFKDTSLMRYGLCLPFGDRVLGRLNYQLEKSFAPRLKATGGEGIFVLSKPH